jgi:transposase
LYDLQAERFWRHLDTCQYRTILHAESPRSECPEHRVKVVWLPWAEAGSRLTALFEGLAIALLKSASQQAVTDLLRLSWDEMHGIMERAVARGLKRRARETIRHLGVEEKGFRKGHSYVTLVNDLEQGRVLYVSEERKQSSLDGFWPTLTAEQMASIEAVAMDMWDPYVALTQAHLPGAESKIVFDTFHLAKHLGEAVDQVRRREHKTMKAAGDERLSGTRYDWLRNRAAMEPEDRRQFDA